MNIFHVKLHISPIAAASVSLPFYGHFIGDFEHLSDVRSCMQAPQPSPQPVIHLGIIWEDLHPYIREIVAIHIEEAITIDITDASFLKNTDSTDFEPKLRQFVLETLVEKLYSYCRTNKYSNYAHSPLDLMRNSQLPHDIINRILPLPSKHPHPSKHTIDCLPFDVELAFLMYPRENVLLRLLCINGSLLRNLLTRGIITQQEFDNILADEDRYKS